MFDLFKENGISFKNANAVYTGGNIWLFYGTISGQQKDLYFLTDDNGSVLILDESPEDFDESLYIEWQNAHKIIELENQARVLFCDKLARRLLSHNKADDLGGIMDDEIKAYQKYWRLPL